MASKQWTAEDIEKIWNSTGSGAQTNTAPLPTLNNTSKKANTSSTYKIKPYENKQYTAEDIEKVWKNVERGKQVQSEMKTKANSAPAKHRTVPTKEQAEHEKINERVNEMAKETEKNLRAQDMANISRKLGDNNTTRYNSRFSLDKPTQKDAGQKLSQLSYTRALERQEKAKKNAERTAEANAHRENDRQRIENEVKAIQAKGDMASQEELDRYDELLKTAEKRGFIEHDSPYLVSREKYNQLKQGTNLDGDLEPLAMAYSTDQGTRGRGVRAIEGMGYNSVDDYVDQLSKRYELTPDEVRDVVKTYQSNKTRAQERQAAIKMYEYGQKHPIAGGVLSALASPASGVEGYYNVAANMLTGDNRNQSNLLSNITEYSKQGGAEHYDSKAAQNAYNFIVGGAGMALNARGGGLPAIASMSGNTANEAMNMAIERGVTPEQAAAYGALAGGADTVFNAIGFNAIEDRLKAETVKGVKDVLKNLGAGALTEAGENVAQDITQTVADEIINGQNSEIRKAYEDYVFSGMTKEDAFKQTAVDYATQLRDSAATGAIGGAVFSGMGMAGKDVALPVLNKAAGKAIDWKTSRDSQKASDLRARLLSNEAEVPTMDEANRIGAEPITEAESAPIEGLNTETITKENAPQDYATNLRNTLENAEPIEKAHMLVDAGYYEDMQEAGKAYQNGTLDADVEQYLSIMEKNGDPTPTKPIVEVNDYDRDALNEKYNGEWEAMRKGMIKEYTGASDEKVDQYYNELDKFFSGSGSSANVEILDDYVEHAPAYKGEMRRGMHFRTGDGEYDKFMAKVHEGSVVTLDKPSSWASDWQVARRFSHLRDPYYDSIEIVCNQNRTSTPVSFANFHGEDEILSSSKASWTLLKEDTAVLDNGSRKTILYVVETGDNTPPRNAITIPEEGSVPNESPSTANIENTGEIIPNNVPPRVGESPSLLAETPTQAEINTQRAREISLRAEEESFQRSMREMQNEAPAETPGKNIVMAEDIGAMPRANAKEKAESIESEPVNRESFNREGQAQFMTNTVPGAGIYNKTTYDNSPTLQEIAKVAKTSNEESFSNAMDVVKTRGQEWYDDVVNDRYKLGESKDKANTDFDTGMIILQGLADELEFAQTDAERQAIVARRDALLRKMKDFSHNMAIGLQAHAKWANTADGAIMAGERLLGTREKVWAGRNKSKVEGNKRIAQALSKIGYDGSMEKAEKAPLSHDQIKKGVLAEIQKEFGSVEDKFTDSDIEFLTNLAENGVSVDVIADEIMHKLNHGEWYTIDESTPVKLQKSSKLASILKGMGDESRKEANKPLDNGYPKKSHATIVEEVTNTLSDEYAGLGLDNPNDIEFIATMIEEGVPNWQIEDEINHRVQTGEWYTLDESIEQPKPTNQRFKNALNSLVGEPTEKVEKPAPTLDELKEQIRNTLAEESSSTIEPTDENIDYLAGLMSQGATTAEIADALDTYMATGSFGISAETQAEVNSYFKAMDRVNPESKEYAQLQAEAFRLIANEVNGKAGALEKFDAWRYLAMLGNPKTMLRNLVGNTMFNAVTGISNTVAALGEEAADRRSIKKTGQGIKNRTRAVINPFDRTAINTAKNDFDLMRYVSGAGTKYKDTKNALRDASSVFDSKAVQLYEKFVNAGISDTFAVRNKYATSLLGYMKANGLTQADMDASYKYDELNRLSRRKLLTESERAEMDSLREIHQKMEDARDFALKEAEYATFHEDNKFADTLSKWSNDSAVAKIFIDGMVPFKKTPANVLRSGLEYSPLGITKSGYLTIKRAIETKGNYADTYEKAGVFNKDKTKEIKRTYANDVIDSWSKSLTGTVMAGLGYLLYSKGVLQSDNEDEKYQDDLEGLQNFSIKLNGHTYTIDWAAPAVMPLLLGAEVKKVMDENAISGRDMDADEVIRIINSTLNPIMETSMLQGVQNTFETMARQASNNNGAEFIGGTIGSLATNLATGYATQAIPTLSGQVARTLDGTRRTTDTASTSAAGSEAEKQLRKTANKIPFLSRINNPYVDARGETRSNNPLEYTEGEPLKNFGKGLVNFAYQSISPGYLQKIDTRPSDVIARNAYNGLDENGKPIKDADVFANWKSQVKINGQKLNPDQMYNYRVASGQANTQIREKLATEDWFNNLSADRQTEILKNTNSLVDHIGKAAADPTYSTESSAYEAYEKNGIDGVIEFYRESAHNKDIKSELGSTADFQKQLYDSGNEARMAKYKEGLSVAQQIMPDKTSLTEEQFLKYEKYGADALKKELNYAKKADELGVSNGKTFQTLVSKGVSDAQIKTAYDAITSTKTGEDEYGRDQYMSFNEDSYNLYQKYGSAGLKEYQEMKQQGVSYETWQQAHKAIPTLSKSSYVKMFKAMDGKTGSDADGTISQKELLYLFNKNNYSESQAKAYWNAFGKISGEDAWKSVPVLKYNKKTGKNEWTTESKKKAK